MQKRLALCAVAFALFAGAAGPKCFAADRATLTGKITDAAGKPLDHATVLVYHASVRTGYSTFCPSCYVDCGKRALTDSSGAFKIDGLSSDLLFQLLVVRPGYTPKFAKVDPLQGPAKTVALNPHIPDADKTHIVRGRAVDRSGDPVRDAVVTPFGLIGGGTTMYGNPPGLDPIAVTDDKGLFELAYSKPVSKMAVTVEARGKAPQFSILPGGPEPHDVTVTDGAVVRGRLLQDGKPVAGAEVALGPKVHWAGMANLVMTGSAYEDIRIGTREDGSFEIPNVPEPETWEFFGKMESNSTRGAIDPMTISTARDGQQIDLGDVKIKKGYSVRGRVVLGDGKPLASGMRIMISSELTQDTQSVLLASDGSFRFLNLAAGSYSIYPNVKGYEIPGKNGEMKTVVNRDQDNLQVALSPAAAHPVQQ